MHRLRIYVDTSVFGGVEDDEFAEASRKFLEQAAKGRFILVVSPEVLRELQEAPEAVRSLLEGLPEGALESAAVSSQVEALADAYIAGGVLGGACRSDAIHVAAATVARADVMVSWNFRHIVNLDRIRKYNAINALNDFPQVEIRSPAEIAYGDEDKDV
jgi:predicted nucleic acid-binding protein